MRVIVAPDDFRTALAADGAVSLFLGGSIEQGKAVNWQHDLLTCLKDQPFAHRLAVLNPRRPDWDASWPNDPAFPPFREQVEWELAAQDQAAILLYYFAPGTVSPITLFELGLYHARNPVIGADPDYTRFGNLE